MAWNVERSRERIKVHLEGMGAIRVEKLVREADLDALLSETECREIFGAHLYASVANFPRLVAETSGDYEVRHLLQAVHIYQRSVTDLVERAETFDGLRVHFQGSKLHALFYRPIDDERELAARAILTFLVIADFVEEVFNPAFGAVGNFSLTGGIDIGDVVGTRNGQRAEKELLFLGRPANAAAKIIRGTDLRITRAVFDALSRSLQDLCVLVPDATEYVVTRPSPDRLDELVREAGHTYDREAARNRVSDDKKAFPLKDIEYSGAETLIDFDQLSIRSNKRVQGASVFADIAGFTAFVDQASTKEEKEIALRVFHAIRKEMSAVLRSDYEGVRVQYQGDRIQGLFHVPKDEIDVFALEAVQCAAGLQSSMEVTIKEALEAARPLHLATGIDSGATLASKLGARGQRDRICLGAAVEHAALIEEICAAGETGISATVWKALPKDVQEAYLFDSARRIYVASALTVKRLSHIQKLSGYQAPSVSVSRVGSAVSIGTGGPHGSAVVPSRSWSK